ncbi:hypothetical protein VP01_1369g7 [Puccinia sorghi]|uniref:Uncharacterized protein n=1 Tax=Puccinia sorghi TaxID=27349 RepID=A0A0L6VNK5_9BASI|nr:hypothetical protein VP01_1369g7 [Puccinia sorghi]
MERLDQSPLLGKNGHDTAQAGPDTHAPTNGLLQVDEKIKEHFLITQCLIIFHHLNTSAPPILD